MMVQQCLMFTGFSCFGLHWIPMIIQRADIRKKYHLQGDIVTDLLTSCCCACCSLVQQDKEVEHQESLLAQKGASTVYQAPEGMAYKN
jgi:Cys-rich protein (TIGR01571 family)